MIKRMMAEHVRTTNVDIDVCIELSNGPLVQWRVDMRHLVDHCISCECLDLQRDWIFRFVASFPLHPNQI